MKQTKRKRSLVAIPAAANRAGQEGQGSLAVVNAYGAAAHNDGLLSARAEEPRMSDTSDGNSASSATAHTIDGAQAHVYALTASCTVRDSLALKSSLLDLLMDQRDVTIDVRAVERIDTAALQVLCAFVRDRKAAGGKVLWVGCTESFREAIHLLGLQQVLGISNAQLGGAAG